MKNPQMQHELRTLIAIRATSQGAFARRVGIKPAALSLYVRGRRQPNASKARRIEAALGRASFSLFPESR